MTDTEPPRTTKPRDELAIHLHWATRKQDDVLVLAATIRNKNLANDMVWIAHDDPSLDALCERLTRLIADLHKTARAAGIGLPVQPKQATARKAGRQ